MMAHSFATFPCASSLMKLHSTSTSHVRHSTATSLRAFVMRGGSPSPPPANNPAKGLTTGQYGQAYHLKNQPGQRYNLECSATFDARSKILRASADISGCE